MSFQFFPQFDLVPNPAVVEAARDAVQEALEAGQLDFAKLPYQDEQTIADIELAAQHFREKFTTFVVIGIGGSDLGARAVHRALNHQFYNLTSDHRIFFVGDTTDPVALQQVIDLLDWKKTGVVIVSKSGNTVEVMSTFLLLREFMQEALGQQHKEHIIAVTDPASGTLRELVTAEGYASLPHPPVGGRFSVFSCVGLFPLALTGIDIRALLSGAKLVFEHHQAEALHYAALQHAAYQNGQHIHVLMPYTYSMREVGFWFRQLWAESLGKALSVTGEEVHVGPTPVAAIGPTDQHSQVQLYREGPNDKTFTFVTMAATTDLHLPATLPPVEALAYLKGRSFNDILHAEQAGTETSLREVGRPTYRIELGQLDAQHIAGLLMFFELATAYAGALFQINAYDQPGVERGKQIMHSLLES